MSITRSRSSLAKVRWNIVRSSLVWALAWRRVRHDPVIGRAGMLLRAAEHHVLEEVGEARAAGLHLVAAARADDREIGDKPRAGRRDRNQRQPVGKPMLLDKGRGKILRPRMEGVGNALRGVPKLERHAAIRERHRGRSLQYDLRMERPGRPRGLRRRRNGRSLTIFSLCSHLHPR